MDAEGPNTDVRTANPALSHRTTRNPGTGDQNLITLLYGYENAAPGRKEPANTLNPGTTP